MFSIDRGKDSKSTHNKTHTINKYTTTSSSSNQLYQIKFQQSFSLFFSRVFLFDLFDQISSTKFSEGMDKKSQSIIIKKRTELKKYSIT